MSGSSGGQRLMRLSRGMHSTIVHGTVLVENNTQTGAYPGQLLRTPWAVRAFKRWNGIVRFSSDRYVCRSGKSSV